MNNYTPKEGITDARQLGMKVKSVHDKEIHQRAR